MEPALDVLNFGIVLISHYSKQRGWQRLWNVTSVCFWTPTKNSMTPREDLPLF